MVNGESKRSLRVEVVYALPDEQVLLALAVEDGTTVGQVIERSGIASKFPEIGAAPDRVGVFGQRVRLDALVRDGDRVEIYRLLTADPKEVRRARARLSEGKKPRG
ncbi:MAG: RnfH family protein [Betaproteobacteria bacterium]|nr:RnfH family protein [Betaproteobacteria bacterium]MDH3437520.1 RnfH family protein [Betaproteobacteria bacterium]